MGVTLERVQFKFASIIGELCSEPEILSQFAVWVDLRLAEYKLKGAISLDCSGESPDPVWLKGIKSAIIAKALASRSAPQGLANVKSNRTGSLVAKRAVNRPSQSRRNLSDSAPQPLLTSTPLQKNPSHTDVSDSPIVIKQEPQDVYPVSLHFHKSEAQKRSLAQTVTSDVDDDSSSAKQKRLAEGETEDQPANESLMSIIGAGENNDIPDASADDQDNVSREIDYLIAQNVAERAKQGIEQAAGDASNVGYASASSSTQNSTRLSQVDPQTVGEGSLFGNPEGFTDVSPFGSQTTKSTLAGSTSFHTSLIRRSRDKTSRLKHVNTLLRYHVKLFERWIESGPSKDSRAIEDIPPKELDEHLVQFFVNVKTQNGADFSKKSLRRVRASLERYLKDQNYPSSITLSPLFSRSQQAFKQKLLSLELYQNESLIHNN